MTCRCRFVTQRALKKALLDYATKTDIANLIDQTALDAALADYVTTQALTDAVANLQAQIDTLQQALIDCGCIVVCEDWIEEFATGIESASLVLGDWSLTWAGAKAKVDRQGASSDLECVVSVDTGITYRDNMTLTYDFDSWQNIAQIQVDIDVFTMGSPRTRAIKTNIPPDDGGVNLDIGAIAGISDGDYISGLKFTIQAVSQDPADYPVVYIDYIRFLCPA